MTLPFNTILHGDCIAQMNKLDAGSLDLAFADPPFNIGYTYDVYKDKLGREQYLDWSRQWISGVHRVLKPTGTFWLAIGDEYAAELKILSQDVGFECRNWVIWYYTFGVNCKAKFTRSHAHLFYFVKDPKEFTFNDMSIRVPSARMLVYGDRRADAKGRLPDDTWILRPQDIPESFSATEDTWHFPRVAGTFKERAGFHGCQMPEQLLGRIIRACSNEGDLVLDPFSGSASTLAVAKKLGRQFLGFDLSPDYVTFGLERLSTINVGDKLVGSAEPSVSAPATHNGVERDATGKRVQKGKAIGRKKSEPAVALTPPTEPVVEPVLEPQSSTTETSLPATKNPRRKAAAIKAVPTTEQPETEPKKSPQVAIKAPATHRSFDWKDE